MVSSGGLSFGAGVNRGGRFGGLWGRCGRVREGFGAVRRAGARRVGARFGAGRAAASGTERGAPAATVDPPGTGVKDRGGGGAALVGLRPVTVTCGSWAAYAPCAAK